jgi:NAD(P)-dependent dehydrogenase (short-subunit alcohol dehydrogenase family)
MPELAPVTTTVRPASGCSARLGTVSRGSVVVTGASTGIGEATATHLKDLGFDVLGGVRKDEDAERLSGKGVQPVKLDLTDEGSIAAAREEIEEASGGRLAALVNNAGIAVAAPLEFIPIDRLRQQIEVNLIGQVAVTQALLAFLRATGGRIVNVSSIGGRIALPMMGPYASSKFGLEAVSDSLRRELRHLGVDVVVVEPGGVRTPIWQKGNAAADEMLADVPDEAQKLYGKLADTLREESRKIETERGLPPSAVAEVIGEALTASKPKTRYMVGRDAKMRWAVAKRVPDRAMDALIARALSGD